MNRAACFLAGLAAAFLATMLPRHASAVTPESKEVLSVIERGLAYLTTASDGRLGGKCLIGLAFLKDGADESHPKVKEAVTACLAATKPQASDIKTDIYSTGIAAIFLCALNPSKYNPEIVKLRDSLEYRQKSCGGWGYPDKETGDTSMTQYAVLAYWEMSSVGIPTSLASTERVADWLIRTQDPDGNWGYQGKEADKYETLKLVKQDPNRLGMTAAALGCTYMVADLLGLAELESTRDSSLPPALKPLKRQQGVLTRKIDPRLIKAAQERGGSWMRKNFEIDPPGHTHYFMYALERYQSFFEASVGRAIKEPTWYNEGYEYLRKNQQQNGMFKSEQANMDAVNTAFGVLFLLRSTKKAIERAKSYGDGALLAGRGLPAGDKVRVRGGQIVPHDVPQSTKELIDILFAPDHGSFAAMAADVDLLKARLNAADEKERGEHVSRLRTLTARGTAEARLAAVTVLSQIKDFESGPALIAALDDPDWQVVLAADEGLRFMGRKTKSVPLADRTDDKARAAAVAHWKTWYVALRPDAEFAN
ncbi:MAG TPA: hypothetical protein VMP01_27500 [Pirellulaceae bacterium]|nr:hypothetical protein [Pirellulaceae bacterium]